MEINKQTIKRNTWFLLAAVILSLASCQKENTTNSTSVYVPVVQAYLIPGNLITVKLYQQKSLSDTANYGAPITGRQVYISDGSKNVLLAESPAGTYTYSDQSFLVAGKTYTLNFKYLTYNVSARTVMPAKPLNFATRYGTIDISSTSNSGPSNSILDVLTWSNPDTLNHILVFLNADEKDFPISSFGLSVRPYNFTINTNRSSYYNLTQNVFPYYGPYQIILFSVNQEYIDLLNSNTSSSTSSTLTNISTNIVNGLGIFTAMQADTVSLNVFD